MTVETPLGFATRAIHAGAVPDPTTGARSTPIFQTTSYVFRDVEHASALFNLEQAGFIYSRLTNPTVAVLEERIANLENGVGACATASGHAAQLLAFFALMQPGDQFIASRQLYGGSINQFTNSFPRAFGWKCNFVDATDPENFRKALNAQTKLIFIENLANPGGIIVDIAAVAAIAQEAGVPLIVDNTLATPFLCRPIEHGATIVVHSSTKFLSGNGTAMGGLIVDSGNFDWGQNRRFPALSEPDSGYHGLRFQETFGASSYAVHQHAVGLRDLGANQQPFNAFLTLLGIETLPLRMERHCYNALKVAQFLEVHPHVSQVSYAGLPSSPFHQLAQKYTPLGAGAVLTFEIESGYEGMIKLVEATKLFSHLANIGDTRSLIIHPASTTHRQAAPEARAETGADVIRLSVGLEQVDDIIADLEQALKVASG